MSFMAPPLSPTRLRKQAIQPWWIVAFVFLQTFVLVYMSVGLPPTTHASEMFSSLNQEHEPHSRNNQDESKISAHIEVKSLEVGGMIVDSNLQKVERRLTKRLNATSVSSCLESRRVDNNKMITTDICQGDENNHIIAYNPALYPRIWCGTTIPAKDFQPLTKKSCKEPPRLSNVEPSVDGTGMPPIHVAPYMPHIILPSFQNKSPRNVTDVQCDIPCKKTIGADVFSGTDYRIVGTEIKILHSLESSQYYGNLQVKEEAYRENQYYSTTSFQSEIPVPYFSINDDIAQPAVDYDRAIRGASFLAKNCESMSNREEIVQDLMKYTRIDSLSSCLHNAEPPNGLSLEGGPKAKKKLMRQYLFHLAFENSMEDDYVTEKLWTTLESGTLPIYYGAPNVKEHAPPNSIISWHDFSSTKELAMYMKQVANNKTLYESYHAWRNKPLPKSFQRKFDFTKTNSVCRMCRFAYSKLYGFGWNYESQTVQELIVSRDVRYDANDNVIHPFREVLPLDGWKRSVWQHDGVIDVHFESLDSTTSPAAVYRMEADVKGEYRQVDANVFVLQNDASRITIMTSWEDAKVKIESLGTIDVLLDPSLVSPRLRVLVEDVDTFHKGADQVASYFGDFMTKDFFAPMHTFHVVGGNLTALAATS